MLTRRTLLAEVCASTSHARATDLITPAIPADEFVDSVGLCTHLESAPYAQHFDAVLRMGASLGVRYVRDELRPSNNIVKWRRLFAEAGIRSHLLVSPATNSIPQMLRFTQALGPRAISAIEGQNEGDSQWFEAQPSARPGWAEVVASYQRAVFQALRERPETRSITILSPTVLDYKPNDMRLLHKAAPFCDVVALHAYLQGQQEPETDADFAGIGWYLRTVRDPFKPRAPAMVTETGYAGGATGISSKAAGIYLPRLLLHLFQSGIRRSFLYEFMDEGEATEDPEQNYGLLTATAAPKPAFVALQHLLGALADPGPAFAPPPIALSVERGAPDLRLLSFRKRSGEIVLAVWRTVRVWDKVARRDLVVPPVPIAIRLPAGSASTAVLDGTAWSDAPNHHRRLELELAGTAMLVRLLP